MILTREIFEWLLSQEYEIQCFSDQNPNDPIRDIRFSEGNSLILSGGTAADDILTIVEHKKDILPERGHSYLICGENGYQKAVNHIMSVFHRFMQWNYALHDAQYAKNDLQTVLDLASSYMDLEIYIINRDLDEVFRSRASSHTWSETVISNGKIDHETFQEIYAFDKTFDETFLNNGLCVYPHYDGMYGRLYYQNIRINSLFSARLLVLVKNVYSHAGQLSLLRQVCNEIAECFLRQNQTERTKMQISQIYRVWAELMDGKDISDDKVNTLLKKINWSNQNRYQTIFLQPIGYQQSSLSMEYYALQLENIFSACLAMSRSDGIYLICNMDRELSSDLEQKLAVFARDNLFKTGSSNIYSQFTKCKHYARQAKDALQVGQTKNPSLWNYAFSDYLYDIFRSYSQLIYPPEDFCPRSLQLLREYDRNNPEICLMETLYQYIKCGFNASIAAENLYIHRTTFNYRMRKINAIAQIDLSNWEELFCIMMYFSMINKSEQ